MNMKHIKLFEEFKQTIESLEYIETDDGHGIEVVNVDDDNHLVDYERIDGVLYELNKDADNLVVSIDSIIHTDGNHFFDNQVDKYVEYLEDGGTLQSFPVISNNLCGYTLWDKLHYMDDVESDGECEEKTGDDFYSYFGIDTYSNNENYNEDFYDAFSGKLDIEDYFDIGFDGSILKKINNIEDLDKWYNKDTYRERYYFKDWNEEDYSEEDKYSIGGYEIYEWNENYYNGLKAVIQFFIYNREYTLTNMNHRFKAVKEFGVKNVYVEVD